MDPIQPPQHYGQPTDYVQLPPHYDQPTDYVQPPEHYSQPVDYIQFDPRRYGFTLGPEESSHIQEDPTEPTNAAQLAWT
jgi:hypothetical protein